MLLPVLLLARRMAKNGDLLIRQHQRLATKAEVLLLLRALRKRKRSSIRELGPPA
jgi:hypothetical protein